MTKPSEAYCENMVTTYDELVICGTPATFLAKVAHKGLVHWCTMCWMQERWSAEELWELKPLVPEAFATR